MIVSVACCYLLLSVLFLFCTEGWAIPRKELVTKSVLGKGEFGGKEMFSFIEMLSEYFPYLVYFVWTVL